MKNIGHIAFRDLRATFTSPVAYVTTAIFVGMSGFLFWVMVRAYHAASQMAQGSPNPFMQAPPELNITRDIIEPHFGNVAFLALLALPLVTMRVFAEERRMGTYELLRSYPITDWELLIGKFVATMTFFLFMLAPTLVFMGLTAQLATPEYPIIVTGYVGIALTGMAFISTGIFFSTLTSNQIIAAFITWGFLLVIWIIGVLESFVPSSWGTILNQISLFPHLNDFSTGVVNSHDIAYFVLWTALFLFLTNLSLESQRWRGKAT